SELRDRSLAPQPFALGGRALVQILPVHVERLRHAVALDPAAQRVGRCPDRLLLAEPPERSTGGVVYHVHQTALRTALLQPRMETAVHLHQFAEVPLALPPLLMRLPLPLPTPQPFGQHPAPQRLRSDVQSVLAGQMFGGQRRPEALPHLAAVLLPHPPQHLLAKRPRLGPSARPPHVAMLQPGRPCAAIPPPQPLRLPITHLQQRRRVHQLQLLALHSRQHFHSPQLTAAHRCSPQCGLLPRPSIRGHFYRGEKGTLSSRYNMRSERWERWTRDEEFWTGKL